MSRITMVLMVVAGMILLGAGVSGFVSDAEVSNARLGSDFQDARYHEFDDLSVERAQQRSRRQQVGMEAVAGLGLMVSGMVLFTPKRKKLAKQTMTAGAEMSHVGARISDPKPLPPSPAALIQSRYAARRRRPNGMAHQSPLQPR